MKTVEEIIASGNLVLVDFYADWCEPCKWLEPILEEVDNDLKGRAQIVKVDIDKFPELAAFYTVKSVPTLILFKNGEVSWRIAGFKVAHELVKVIESHM